MPRPPYERWHEVAALISQSKKPFTFWPKLDTKALEESEDPQAKFMAQAFETSKSITTEFLQKKEAAERDTRYSEEGRSEVLRDLVEEYQSKLEAFRDQSVPHLKDVAADRLSTAQAESLPEPKTQWEIALAVDALRLAREAGWGFKELREASPGIRAAVALAEPEHAGLSREAHGLIYREAALSSGGDLAAAAEFAEQVQATEEALEFASVTMDSAAGLKPSHPEAVKGREMREALAQEQEGAN